MKQTDLQTKDAFQMNLAVMILLFYRAIYPNSKHNQKVTPCVKWGEKGKNDWEKTIKPRTRYILCSTAH